MVEKRVWGLKMPLSLYGDSSACHSERRSCCSSFGCAKRYVELSSKLQRKCVPLCRSDYVQSNARSPCAPCIKSWYLFPSRRKTLQAESQYVTCKSRKEQCSVQKATLTPLSLWEPLESGPQEALSLELLLHCPRFPMRSMQ